MNLTYNRLSTGDRLREKRNLLGFTQDEVAEKIGRAAKYYADIERGSCGMSLDTLISLSNVMDLSLDYIILGKIKSEKERLKNTDETEAVLGVLNTLPMRERTYALRLLKMLLEMYK